MDTSNEGFLLIATTSVLLVCLAVAVLAVMLIYRRRRLQHKQEVLEMNERFERELLRSQLEVQNQTMQHIGREIHDNVGSQLTLAYLYTHQLPEGPEGQPSMSEEIGRIIDESLQELRSLSKSLIQGQVQQQTSLRELLRQECHKLNSVNFCEVTFAGNAPDKPGTVEVNSFVLRIVQEFAQNSLKHAKCQHIRVRLDADAGRYRLTAEDDGVGFDLQGLPDGGGIGLLNMRQRADIIHATFDLQSTPGQGTRLTLGIPTSNLIPTDQ